jgi:hypothetical protein
MALSAFDAPFKPLRPVDVIAGSRLAILQSFIHKAEGVLPIIFAYLIMSELLLCNFPNGS